MNNIRAVLRFVVVAVATLVTGAVLFVGSLNLYSIPDFHARIDAPGTSRDVGSPVDRTPVVVTENVNCEERPTNTEAAEAPYELNGPGGPTIFYANFPSVIDHNYFGTPLDSRLNPLVDSKKVEPDVRNIVSETWYRLCHDSMFAKATVAAAFPDWEGLRGEFDWQAAINMLDTLHWESAEMRFHKKPPTEYTMLAKGTTDASEPTAYIVRATHAGWYLHVPDDTREDALIARSACGGQPSLRVRANEAHAALREIYEIIR